jgi:tetratricopeptide (TPR) repeat protein
MKPIHFGEVSGSMPSGRRPVFNLPVGIRFLLLFLLLQAIVVYVRGKVLRGVTAVAASSSTVAGTRGTEQNIDATGADPAAIFQQGMQALKIGQLALAEKDFQSVLSLNPKSSPAHINMAVAYMREKRWDEALVELRKAELLSPNEPGIQLNIGLAYYRRNDFVAAIKPFSATLQRKPDSLQARYLLGLCYFFTDKYKEAKETLAPLWPSELNNLNYLYVVSIAANKSADGNLKKQAFDQMLAIGQDKPEFHLYVGKAWLAEDNTVKALEEFRAAEAAQPELPLVHYFLGRILLEQHADELAETELLKDVAIEPGFPYNYEDLGILYAESGRPEKAEHSFLQAIQLDRTLVNSYLGLAKIYRKASRYKEALEMLDHAVALAPESASVHFLRGQVLAHLDQPVKAQQEFDTSEKLLKLFNQQVQQNLSGDRSADAQHAAQQ